MAKGEAGFFVHGADADGVLLAAVVASPEETGGALAHVFAVSHLVDVDRAAVDAAGAGTPTLLFEELDRRQFVRAGQWDFAHQFGLAQFGALGGLLLHGGDYDT